MALTLRGRPLVEGAARGEILYSDEPLSFWGGYEAASGEIIDRRHPLAGRSAAGCVLALPATRGSSTTTAVLLEAIRCGAAPAALLTSGPDRYLALASIVAQEMYGDAPPVVSLEADDFALLADARSARVDRDGLVTVEPA